MRKILRIISVSTGIVSVVSAVILGFIYLEDILKCFQKMKTRSEKKIRGNRYGGDDNEYV